MVYFNSRIIAITPGKHHPFRQMTTATNSGNVIRISGAIYTKYHNASIFIAIFM
jgi:hypothetical protein